MKKMILGLGLGIVLSSMISATAVSLYDLKNNTAEVEQVRGVYVFTSSRPLKEYEYLGTVGCGMNSTYDYVIDGALKNAAKKYPNAEGIIMDMKTYKADVIKFK